MQSPQKKSSRLAMMLEKTSNMDAPLSVKDNKSQYSQ